MSLTILDLNFNSLQGTIPYNFVNLRNLEHLDLSENPYITGNLPSILGNLCKLNTLSLKSTNIGGNIGGFLDNFSTCLNSSLEFVDLSLMACLEVKKWRGSRVKGGGVVQLPCLEVF